MTTPTFASPMATPTMYNAALASGSMAATTSDAMAAASTMATPPDSEADVAKAPECVVTRLGKGYEIQPMRLTFSGTMSMESKFELWLRAVGLIFLEFLIDTPLLDYHMLLLIFQGLQILFH